MILEITFWFCVIILYYIYDGYWRLLRCIAFFAASQKSNYSGEHNLPSITLLITVFNEARVIEEKIQNAIICKYPFRLIEILVASDGSTDDTDDIVSMIELPNVRLFRPTKRIGKTDTQNQAISMAKGEIVIFTDADTRFNEFFLKNIISPFSDPLVGGVDGHLLFVNEKTSSISKSKGNYWDYELRLRQLESKLGILAVASGACLAIRRNLYRPIDAEYGEDCIIPLDIVKQGYKIVHASNAIAYELLEHDIKKEFNTRVRMTLRNLQGTLSRSSLLNPVRNFGYAFALWSHKLLRWFSPIFLILLTISTFIIAKDATFFIFVSIILICFYVMAFFGWIAEFNEWDIPIVKIPFSFVLANIGFFVGLVRFFVGHRITAYRNESQ